MGYGLPVGSGSLPGGAAIAYGPPGTNAVDVLGGVGTYTGYGLDITGWGSGYGTGWAFGYANPSAGERLGGDGPVGREPSDLDGSRGIA
jgi:hypothetical protein